jgi:hypothetical protein
MRGILASYRWRRRLAWLTATGVLVAGAIAAGLATGLTWNRVPKQYGPSNVPARIDNSAPKPLRLKHHDERQMLAVASKFIDTAVARKHIDRSWELASSELRSGFSRKEWETGDMPVTPYPVGQARFRLQFADSEGVGFSVVLLPAKGSHQPSQEFLMGLRPLGSGKQRHWVVDYWQPAPTVSAAGSAGQAPPSGSSGSVSTAKESKAWLLLPAGLLSLIVLLPLSIASLHWYRTRRADRALLRS